MSRPLPLAGYRIVSAEQYGAGPYGTMFLAQLGAEVIKIEPPRVNGKGGGDTARMVGPHFLREGESLYFQSFNLNKKSLTLDLNKPEGQEVLHRLVGSAHAVANNLRGDLPARLGLTYEALAPFNRAIVCAHLSAYGRDNARARWPGYDYLMQAEAGFCLLTGEPGGDPQRFGLSMVDFMTGTMMATGLLAAILGARKTGQGCDVDTSLFDTALHQLSYPATWYLNEGARTGRLPRGAHPSIAPSQLFRTQDGWLMLMCQTPKFWDEFIRLIGRSDIGADPRFIDIPGRRKNLAALTEALDAVLVDRPTDAWMALLGGKVPCAPVHDVAEALDSRWVREIAMTDVVEHPDREEGLRMLACPIRVNGARMPGARAPKLGEHTEEVLGR